MSQFFLDITVLDFDTPAIFRHRSELEKLGWSYDSEIGRNRLLFIAETENVENLVEATRPIMEADSSEYEIRDSKVHNSGTKIYHSSYIGKRKF